MESVPKLAKQNQRLRIQMKNPEPFFPYPNYPEPTSPNPYDDWDDIEEED